MFFGTVLNVNTTNVQVDRDRIQLLVAIVEYKSKLLVEPRRGVCSTYLANIVPGSGEYVPPVAIFICSQQ